MPEESRQYARVPEQTPEPQQADLRAPYRRKTRDTYKHTCIPINKQTAIPGRKHTRTHTYDYVHGHVHTHMHARMHTHVRTCARTYMYIYIYIYIYLRTCVLDHTYTYTYKVTCIPTW